MFAGTSSNIPSYTVYVYDSGQSYTLCMMHAHLHVKRDFDVMQVFNRACDEIQDLCRWLRNQEVGVKRVHNYLRASKCCKQSAFDVLHQTDYMVLECTSD